MVGEAGVEADTRHAISGLQMSFKVSLLPRYRNSQAPRSLVHRLRSMSVTRLTTHLLEIGSFLHPVESEMLCNLTLPTRIPYFNAPIYLSNKTQIGKVDEILGPINEVYFTVKMDQGMTAGSFKKEDKVYIGGDKLLPIERFLPKPKVPGQKGEWSPPW